MNIFDAEGQSMPPAHLPICPGMIDLGRMMFDIIFMTWADKDICKHDSLLIRFYYEKDLKAVLARRFVFILINCYFAAIALNRHPHSLKTTGKIAC